MRIFLLHIILLHYSICFAQLPGVAIHSEDSLLVKQYLSQGKLAMKNNATSAIMLFSKAAALSEKINYLPGIADGETGLGNLYLYKKQYKEALTHFEKAKPVFQKLNNEAALGRLYKAIGDAYSAQTFNRQAFDNYREANTLLRKTNQLDLYVKSVEATGNIVLNFGSPKSAIGFYKRSLAARENLNDIKGIVDCNKKIAGIYFTEKIYDSALYFNKASALYAKGDNEALADAAIQELIILTFLKNNDEAEKAKQKAEALVNSQDNATNKIRLMGALSNYYLMLNDKETAKKYFDSGRAMMSGRQNPELVIPVFSEMAEINRNNGDYKAAYNAMVSLDRYKDIFRNENMDRMSAEIKNVAEAGLKEKEIEYLNLVNRLKEEQLSKEELKRMTLLRENILKDSSISNQQLLMAAMENESALRNAQLRKEKELSLSLGRENELKQKLLNDERRNKWMLWAGIAVLAFAGGIIFWQYKKQCNKNTIINKQTDELEVLNKEIHHRVKNNLQVISSMLDLQSQSLQDEKATAIIKEGIQRVQSMAFIHQNLYQGNAVNSVNMNEYIKMLSNHLFQTYNIRTDKIKFHTQIEDLKLHTDTAIPLGMILNELISNSLKYAFPQDAVHKEKDTGDIWVTMKKTENELLLQVKDNGIGLPVDFNPENTSSFGYEIIKAFSQKLKARMNVDGNNGTDVQIIISKFKTTG
jgi:two-component system, sensor histidine kinase PdtaS